MTYEPTVLEPHELEGKEFAEYIRSRGDAGYTVDLGQISLFAECKVTSEQILDIENRLGSFLNLFTIEFSFTDSVPPNLCAKVQLRKD